MSNGTTHPRIFRLPTIPDSHVGQDYFTLLLQIEATKGRLRSNIGALRKTAQAPFEFLESTKDVLGQAAQVPIAAINKVEQQVEEHPWMAMGAAVATGAVGGYFDDGRLERFLAGLPGEISAWISSLVGRLASAAAGGINQLVTQSVVGAVTAATAVSAVSAGQEDFSDVPPQARTAPVDVDELEPRVSAPLEESSFATGAV